MHRLPGGLTPNFLRSAFWVQLLPKPSSIKQAKSSKTPPFISPSESETSKKSKNKNTSKADYGTSDSSSECPSPSLHNSR